MHHSGLELGNAFQEEEPGTQKVSKIFGILRKRVDIEMLHVLHKSVYLLVYVKYLKITW